MARDYHVYGIGNALVDLQYEVEPGFLERMGIPKGGMTLVDEARQRQLVSEVGRPERKRSSGGSAANTLIGVAGFGGRSYYGCRVGRDEMGDFFLQDLRAAGVEANPDLRGEGATGRCLVFITPDADRTMNTFLGVTSTFGPDQVEETVVRRSDLVYIEGYLLSSDSGFAAAQAAQEMANRCGTRVAFTLSDPFIVAAFRGRVETILGGGVDLLFCNEAEALSWTGAADAETALEELGRRVERRVITLGPRGAQIGVGPRAIPVPPFPARAVDTNGAGDMFAGGFLYGITHGCDEADSGKLAAYAAARVVSQYGPRLEESLRGKVDRILSL